MKGLNSIVGNTNATIIKSGQYTLAEISEKIAKIDLETHKRNVATYKRAWEEYKKLRKNI